MTQNALNVLDRKIHYSEANIFFVAKKWESCFHKTTFDIRKFAFINNVALKYHKIKKIEKI